MSVPMKVLIAGGGTGGHLFPGIAVAEALKRLKQDTEVSFVGSRKKLEATIVPKHGYPFDAIWIAGLQRRFSFNTLLLPFKLAVALAQSFSILQTRNPDVVVGTGGYVAGPVVYMAARMKRKTLIHEQNEYPGLTTRRLASLVDEVHLTFDTSRKFLPKAKKIIVSGNPVRISLHGMLPQDARSHFGLDPQRKTVLVFGGSLGASSINMAVRDALPRFLREKVQLIWQTGAHDYDQLHHLQDQYSGDIVIKRFIEEMNAAFAAATLVVCRAGATSIAELTAMGIPAILIPYPFAAENHQHKNAEALEKAGAAVLFEDRKLSELESEIFRCIHDDSTLESMAKKSKSIGKPSAAYDIAEAIIRLAESRQGKGS